MALSCSFSSAKKDSLAVSLFRPGTPLKQSFASLIRLGFSRARLCLSYQTRASIRAGLCSQHHTRSCPGQLYFSAIRLGAPSPRVEAASDLCPRGCLECPLFPAPTPPPPVPWGALPFTLQAVTNRRQTAFFYRLLAFK